MSRLSYPASTAFVAALVDALGLSAHGGMTELATLTGLDRRTVYRWHRGQTEVRPSHVMQIAARLGRAIVIGSQADGSPLVIVFPEGGEE
jgi:transcriptional regulator with XRE-family HTH domain